MDSKNNENKHQVEIDYINAQIDKLSEETSLLRKSTRRYIIIFRALGLGIALLPLVIGYGILAKPFFELQEVKEKILTKKNELLSIKMESIRSDSIKLIAIIDSLQIEADRQTLINLNLLNRLDEKNKELSSIAKNIKSEQTKKRNIITEESEKKNIEDNLKVIKQIEENTADLENAISKSTKKIEKLIEDNIGEKGWIYIGHYKKGTFRETNKINIDEYPIEDSVYTLIKEAPLSSKYPIFNPWKLEYEFAPVLFKIRKGTTIKILDDKEVGANKIWCKIEILGRNIEFKDINNKK